jgi:hypothetical protein
MPEVAKIVDAAMLPDRTEDIPDDILRWAVRSPKLGRPFKIIKQELDFYRTHHIPLPRLHPDERHLLRMSLRNPRTIFKRTCQECGSGIETTYAPGELKRFCVRSAIVKKCIDE